MAHYDPTEAFEVLKQRISSTVQDQFPIEGKKNSLHLAKVWVDDNKHLDDIRSQKEARLKERTWAVPMRAELVLKDKATGKVKDKQIITLAQLPKITNRYTYIVGGNEWQVNNMFRLKSGVYTHVKANGELASQWNLAKGLNFDMDFNPKTKKMSVKFTGKGANIPLYPLLKILGVDDDTIERKWGKEVLNVNRKDKTDVALRKFYKTFTGTSPESIEEAQKLVIEEFDNTQMRPEATKLTLGKPFDKVNGQALLAGSDRILRVSRQEEAPDDRDSLEFKDLHSAEDLIAQRIVTKHKWDIQRKIQNNVDKQEKIKAIVHPDIFGKPVRNFFTQSNLSERPDQMNPMSYISGNRRTTIRGEGGITKAHQVTLGAKIINPSHLGFLDPIQTPECYDDQTEVFTKDGWKKWPDVTEDDLLACQRGGHGSAYLEFRRPEALHRSHYRGQMYGLKAGKIDYLVTPNHRMLVSTSWNPDTWRIVKAPEVHGKERRFDCKHGPFVPKEEMKEFALPRVEGGNATKFIDNVSIVAWAEFMGWFLSEGSCQYNESSSAYLVRLHQSRRASPDNYQRLLALTERLPWNWSEESSKTAFATGSKQLARYLIRFGKAQDKYIPEYFFDAPIEAREALLESLLLGDGRIDSNRKDGRSYRQEVYTTTSERLAKDVERLAIGLGHSVSMSTYEDNREEHYLDIHEVRLLQHRYRTARPAHPNYPAQFSIVDYDGEVYCATVPGGLLYVRRGDGVGFWCGNSEKIGSTLQLALGARKKDKTLQIPAWDTKTGKKVWLDAGQALRSTLAYPDQFKRVAGKMVPVSKNVKVTDAEGQTSMAKASDVDYVLNSTKGMFDLSANLIPFLQSDQGNRTMVASKQMEQAVALQNREAPLVQVKSESPMTFEQIVGGFSSHLSPVDGTITKITEDGITIRDNEGKRHEVQLYDNFPLNDDKSVLNSTPLVGKGDVVEKGQPVGDTNYTKDGVLSLGTNLRVAYMPYKGYNFEDGIVISDTAAKKLTSEHMFRSSATSEKNIILDKKKFDAEVGAVTKKEVMDKLDDGAVIREGETVNQGDILIGVLRKEEVTPEQQKIGLFSKKLIKPVRPRPIIWDKEVPGTVSRVVKHGKKTTVYVRALTPADVGDKIVGRHGNKGIIGFVLPDNEMPQTKDDTPAEVLLNPTGIPSRINLGQVLETAASKIARKTGKPYIVNNFDPSNHDYTRNLMKELEKHGLTDTEEMFDPVTKRNFGKVLFGDQYILKLHHTAAKGLSVRSRHAYDSNMTPQKGGPQGGQTMDAMGLYAMLAHNARENVREMQTYKCFLRRTMVETDQGPMMISNIVNRKLPVKVLSWNEEKRTFEYRNIMNYSKRKIDTPLVKVEFMARNSRGEYKRAVTKCTGGHKFFTTVGEVEARDLEGKTLLTQGLRPDSYQFDVLVGSLLGDGHLSKRHHHFPSFQERHSIKQREYLEFKAAVLADFSTRDVRDYCAGEDGFNVGQDMCEWGTLAQPSFLGNKGLGLYGMFYEDNVKKVPGHCANLLTPLAVAVWYQDDGSLSVGPRQRVVKLHTGSFTAEDRAHLIEGLETKIGVRFTESKNNNSVDLRLGKHEDIDKFFRYIRAFVHPSMAYKLGYINTPPDVGEGLDRVLDEAQAKEVLVEVPVLRVEGYDNPTFNDGAYLYNIEVEENHNYFANRVLVGNSDMNDDFWAMLQAGDSPPTPKVPFVFKKFEGYLKGMGLDIDKQGNDLILQPLTDEKTLQMSNGALKDPGATLIGRNLKPEPGGIFDPDMTGFRGIGPGLLGDKWSHIPLAERMPNPVFEKPARSLLGLTKNQYEDVIKSKLPLGDKTGPVAVVDALSDIDVSKEINSLEKELPDLRTTKLNQANSRLKYLRALKRAKMSATDAYTMKHVPVMPPVMRPVSILDNGQLNLDDINKLYTMLGNTNQKLREHDPKVMPEEEAHPLRAELYDGLKALTLTGAINKGRHLTGISMMIAGKAGSPKEGFFQDKVIGKRQDLSMRGTIVPEPSMSLDEVGIPRKAAQELYKPFVVARLTRTGLSPLQAQKEIKNETQASWDALQYVVNERPLLLKRDPVLHKFGVQAFRPKLVEGKAIKIHPLATSGYNADFDGDKMSAFVPVSAKAVKEALKMVPSNNLFSPSSGSLVFKPSHESMIGLYKLTEMEKSIAKRFSDVAMAADAVKAGKINYNTPILLDNIDEDILKKLAQKTKPVKTTIGRLLLYQTLPEGMRSEKILKDPAFRLDKVTLNDLLTEVARDYKGDFSRVADRMKDMGNDYATGLSIGLKDFASDHQHRDTVLKVATKEEAKIRANARMSNEKKDEAIVSLYSKAGELIGKRAKAKADVSDNRMYDWVKSGARGSWDQFRQMTVAPMLVADARGRKVPVPIGRSYSEGLDIGSYWTSMHGARMGTINKVEGTWRPGLMGKQIMQTTMDQMIVDEDCGTTKGLRFSINNRDALGRFTVGDIQLGKKTGQNKGIIESGTLVTPDVLNRLKNNKVVDVRVRSPLKCAHGKGMCSKCYGLNENGQLHQAGVNVGILAAHRLGEPATQLSMSAFHSGGVVGAKETAALSTFDRLDQLLKLPKKLRGAATLSHATGDVQKIETDPAGGWNVFVAGQRHYVPANRELLVKRGKSVKVGDTLSSGVKNPREMKNLTGMNSVRSYLVDEIQKAYQDEAPLSRRNTETFVRAMTNLSEVLEPGDHPDYLRGDHVPTSEIVAFNSDLKGGQKPITHDTILQGVEMLPLELQEDWIARLQSRGLKNTIIDAASEGWRSQLHSTHPIPGMAYGAEFGTGITGKPWLY